MSKRTVDLVVAVIVLIAGAALVILGQQELGSIAFTTALAYIAGSFRDKPGGLDEAVKIGLADLQFIDEDGDSENA